MNVLGCEGNAEVYLIDSLIKRGHLLFNKNDLLDMRPIHFRQPIEIAPLIDILTKDTEITFYRIGDTQKEEYDFERFNVRKEHIKVIKLCTMPEIEILIVINEGLYDEYLKVKSKMMPKQFVKERIKSFSSFKQYVSEHDMLFAIKEYKRIKKHKNGEGYLADILKE